MLLGIGLALVLGVTAEREWGGVHFLVLAVCEFLIWVLTTWCTPCLK